jgi:hypothetical protein
MVGKVIYMFLYMFSRNTRTLHMGYRWNKSMGGIFTTWRTTNSKTVSILEPIAIQMSHMLKEKYPIVYTNWMHHKFKLYDNCPWTGLAINYGFAGDATFMHTDASDEVCSIFNMGDFEGGDFIDLDNKTLILAAKNAGFCYDSKKPHGALPVTLGLRITIVFFVHTNLISENAQTQLIYTPLKKRTEEKFLKFVQSSAFTK